jgi:hypothetical protein
MASTLSIGRHDSIEDLKAAFVCVANSLNAKFESPEDLAKGIFLN